MISGGVLRTALHTLQYRNQCVPKEAFNSVRLLV